MNLTLKLVWLTDCSIYIGSPSQTNTGNQTYNFFKSLEQKHASIRSKMTHSQQLKPSMTTFKKRDLTIKFIGMNTLDCDDSNYNQSPRFEREESSLIAPSEDKRPTSDRVNLKIPQAYGLSQSPQEKSLFRYHPFNPMKYEKPLSPGAEIGNYCRSPRASLASLSPRNSDAKVSRICSRGRGKNESKTFFSRTPRNLSTCAPEVEKSEVGRQFAEIEKIFDRSSIAEYLE